MIHLQQLIGTVITIRSIWGNEYVAMLTGYNQDGDTIMVTGPQTVAMENDAVMLVPFTVTGSESQAVTLNNHTIFAIVPASEEVSKNYQKIISG
jgi:uncharacterized lipoprotein YajG